MRYECKNILSEKDKSIWEASIKKYKEIDDGFEAVVAARGTEYHFIVGRSFYGNYLNLVSNNVSLYLAQLDDVFWNAEKLSSLINNNVDSSTVAYGIKELAKKFCKKDDENEDGLKSLLALLRR